MNFHDHLLLDQSNTVEEFLSRPTDHALGLTELFSLLRTWNKSIHQHFSRLILLVGFSGIFSILVKSVDYLFFRR